ncbi:hypothetical protein [Cupriavidus sp.]|uniref:hypothetical protein n=1 Tax=Cupriavidus sp. TaxID=1873897 RepID=UPI0028BE06C4|nr:hypothetical protein [Cupriavidus sp.]
MHITNVVGQVVEIVVGPVKHRVVNPSAVLARLGIETNASNKSVSTTQQISITDAEGSTYVIHLQFREGTPCLAVGEPVVTPSVAAVEAAEEANK